MSDSRTLREKLEAMAERGTEHEREIAREKLEAMGDRLGPPPPPTRNAASAPEPGPWFGFVYSGTSSSGWFADGTNTFEVRWEVHVG